MKKIIAKVGLTYGQVGFYDPITNIHLTIAHPTADVYQGSNTSRLLTSVASKRITVLEGSLTPEIVEEVEVPLVEPEKVKEIIPEVEVVKAPEEITEAIEEVPVETVAEVEEEVKKSTKKKSTKKVDE